MVGFAEWVVAGVGRKSAERLVPRDFAGWLLESGETMCFGQTPD